MIKIKNARADDLILDDRIIDHIFKLIIYFAVI